MLRRKIGPLTAWLLVALLLAGPGRPTRAAGDSARLVSTTAGEATLSQVPSSAGEDAAVPSPLQNSPCPRSVLFIDDRDGLSNTGADGYSILRDNLVSMGFVVQRVFPGEISAALVAPHDIVVFSLSWAGEYGQRELNDAEASALVDFVNSGKSLFLVGELGLSRAVWAYPWRTSLNRIGLNFGIMFREDMLCSSASHVTYPGDPDEGIDMPVIGDLSARFQEQGITQFAIIWGSTLQVSSPAHAFAHSDSSSWRDRTCTWDLVSNSWLCKQSADELAGSYPVLAAYDGTVGRILAIGDSSWMLNGWITLFDNLKLARKAFSWLARLPSAQVLTARPNPGVAPEKVFFSCRPADPYAEPRVAEYHWDFDGDGVIDSITATPKTGHVYETAGTYQASCQLIDLSGCTGSSQALPIAISPNIPPLIDMFMARVSGPDPPLDAQFVCQAHDPNGAIKKYLFEFGDGSPFRKSYSGIMKHTYRAGGVYIATCTAVDFKGGQTHAQPLTIFVNTPPVIDSFTATPTQGEAPLQVSFSCNAHDPDGMISSYRWYFGDGKSTTTPTGTTHHRYLTGGTYSSTCLAIDNKGRKTRSDPIPITLKEPSAVPD